MSPNPTPPHDDLPAIEAQQVFFRFLGEMVKDQLRVHYLLFLIVFGATFGAIFYLIKLDIVAGVVLGILLWFFVNIRRYRLLLQATERKHRKLYEARRREAVPVAVAKSPKPIASAQPVEKEKKPEARPKPTPSPRKKPPSQAGIKPLQKPKPPASL